MPVQHVRRFSLSAIRAIALLFAAIGGISIVSGAPTMSTRCPESGTRVFVSSSGIVTLNGTVVEPENLLAALRALEPPPTVLCYAREAPIVAPQATLKLIVDALMAMRLPINFFTDASFQVPFEPS